MLDLNALIGQADPLRASFVLTQARAINEGGWIVGTALAGGVLHAVLLTPVPEPSAAALWLLAGAARACCVRIRSRPAVRRAPCAVRRAPCSVLRAPCSVLRAPCSANHACNPLIAVWIGCILTLRL